MLGQRPGKKSLTSIALKNVTYGLLITDVLFYYKNLILLINKQDRLRQKKYLELCIGVWRNSIPIAVP